MFIHKIDEDLSLKLPDPRDAEEFFKLTDSSREYLREWLPWLDGTRTPEDTKEFLSTALANYAAQKSMTTLILFKGKVAGTAGFNSIDWSSSIAYVGYWLGSEFQGNGIMTRAVSALTDYAFHDLQLNKVEVRAAVQNKKSRSIPERLNFTNEGKIRQAEKLYGQFVDHQVYGMLADEWNNSGIEESS
ncbi:N-acetyltransferase [Bacillus salacetis]|uniref:N-acetyltransferase n=1 Tax=Bacillus salacetis TaxID=2315464 RepID=A0A3A1R6P9_9BACI|nr:GNAT family protein [Bacillus salacetis]RIW38508.1 N-acetyltransferase [Bacillus salacetis]